MSKIKIKLSESTMMQLSLIIIEGYRGGGKRRSEEEVVKFFNLFGSKDTVQEYFPYLNSPLALFFSTSNKENEYNKKIILDEYNLKKLKEYNNTPTIINIVRRIFHPRYFYPKSNKSALKYIDKYIKNDGYQLMVRQDRHSSSLVVSTIRNFTQNLIESEKNNKSKENDKPKNKRIDEQLAKIREKFDKEDYSGTITNARTLTEEVLGMAINDPKIVKKCHGSLIKLYKEAARKMEMDLAKGKITTGEKQILSGLINLVNGIGSVSNQMGDRHASTYEPDRRHAKLTMNTAITFYDFITATYIDQQGKLMKKGKNSRK